MGDSAIAWVMTGLMGAGALLAFGAAAHLWTSADPYEGQGETVMGRVVEVHDEGWSLPDPPTVRYTTKDGESVTTQARDGCIDYTDPVQPGDALEVYYQPTDPTDVCLAAKVRLDRLGGIVFAIVGLFVTGLSGLFALFAFADA
ncbi:MAG: DUF3592 domain-containing protein [Nocardioidaceae bacterium]